MPNEVTRWRVRSPGDLSVALPEVEATPVEPAIAAAVRAAEHWARVPFAERVAMLRQAHREIERERDALAEAIAIETGKPMSEARGEMTAVLAKFDYTIVDAAEALEARRVNDGPHPAQVRRRARGPAVVIGPFNFPLHLANGALLAHLASGNPVLFKPSPLAAVVAGRYAELMRHCFPDGVFSLVQGGAAEGQALCMDARVRAICFTGSVPVGRALAQALAADFSKELALELGGRNAAIICGDADLDLAAKAVADGMCLTCGQRCNATSRILVAREVAESFAEKLLAALESYRPGHPLREETKLGPLISEASLKRYASMMSEPGEWLLEGGVVPEADGKRGYYVQPAIRRGDANIDLECFVPVAGWAEFDSEPEAVEMNNASPFGLAASVFTRSAQRFERFADRLHAGNVYANLPTTFSPSTLPFGGWGWSGNGRPGGRGFARFCTVEQAIQTTGLDDG